MNTTININLAGQLFYMDENAYGMLKSYLEEIAAYFKNSEIREELMSDIEGRISELFSEKMTHERQVITSQEVAYVIEVMGQPKDYHVSDDEESEEGKRTEKKFFRDLDDAVIGGVAAGVAHYFGFEVSWVRIIWLLLALFSWGGFIILYFALWAFIAPAKTTAEKLSMKGEPINISNLEKKFKEGINDVKERIKEVDYEAKTKKVRSGLQRFFDALGSFIQVLIRVLGKLIGVILIIVSFATLFSLTISIFAIGLADIFGFPFTNVEDFISFTSSGLSIWFASIPIHFAIGIPFVFLAILGQRMIGASKKSNKTVLFIMLGLWLSAIIATIAMGLYYASVTF